MGRARLGAAAWGGCGRCVSESARAPRLTAARAAARPGAALHPALPWPTLAAQSRPRPPPPNAQAAPPPTPSPATPPAGARTSCGAPSLCWTSATNRSKCVEEGAGWRMARATGGARGGLFYLSNPPWTVERLNRVSVVVAPGRGPAPTRPHAHPSSSLSSSGDRQGRVRRRRLGPRHGDRREGRCEEGRGEEVGREVGARPRVGARPSPLPHRSPAPLTTRPPSPRSTPASLASTTSTSCTSCWTPTCTRSFGRRNR